MENDRSYSKDCWLTRDPSPADAEAASGQLEPWTPSPRSNRKSCDDLGGIPTLCMLEAEPYPSDQSENIHYAVTRRKHILPCNCVKVGVGVTYPVIPSCMYI